MWLRWTFLVVQFDIALGGTVLRSATHLTLREEKSNGTFEGPAWQGVGIFHPDSRLDLVQSLFFLPHWKKKSATQFVSLHSYTRTDIQFQLKCDSRRVHSAASGTVCVPVRLLVCCFALSLYLSDEEVLR